MSALKTYAKKRFKINVNKAVPPDGFVDFCGDTGRVRTDTALCVNRLVVRDYVFSACADSRSGDNALGLAGRLLRGRRRNSFLPFKGRGLAELRQFRRWRRVYYGFVACRKICGQG